LEGFIKTLMGKKRVLKLSKFKITGGGGRGHHFHCFYLFKNFFENQLWRVRSYSSMRTLRK